MKNLTLFRIFALVWPSKKQKSRFYLITSQLINPIFLILFANSETIHPNFLSAYILPMALVDQAFNQT
ncbi:MAG TPA: hypothetical protein VFC92_03955 [Bacteroidales bacterium]|nr:hypothetical protein [Bacteroidales bacterium]